MMAVAMIGGGIRQEVGSLKEGSGRTRHLRVPAVRSRRTRGSRPKQDSPALTVGNVAPWLGLLVDAYA